MKTKRIFSSLIFLCLFINNASAIVIRHDMPASQYNVDVLEVPSFLIDMPHEGHGVLINENWIVTVAHVIFYDYIGKSINISGNEYKIEKVVIHPEYKKIPKELLTGNSLRLMEFNIKNKDIALIKLASSVIDVKPVSMYQQSKEIGMKFTLYGKGATGNGQIGQIFKTKEERKLRFCKNIVSDVTNSWLIYQFDKTPKAIKYEGMHGSGDSGSPSIVHIDHSFYLIGLSAWQFIDGEMGVLQEGLYETPVYQVRISNYIDWINRVIKNG